MEAVVFIAVVVLAYGVFHHGHYRRNRRSGFGFWVSMRGPFNTRISKRF